MRLEMKVIHGVTLGSSSYDDDPGAIATREVEEIFEADNKKVNTAMTDIKL